VRLPLTLVIAELSHRFFEDPVRSERGFAGPMCLATDPVSIIDLDVEVCPGGEYTHSLFGIESFRPDGIYFSNTGKVWLGMWLGEELTRRYAAGEWDNAAR
jgi:hypothetical protein